MANGISSDPREPVQPIPSPLAASTRRSATVDAAREGSWPACAVAGSWIDGDACLELEFKQALREALAAEEARLDERVGDVEERVAELEAQMHLALARGQEDEARAAIFQIVSERRRGRALSGAIDRIRRARARLASARRGSASSRSPARRRAARSWL